MNNQNIKFAIFDMDGTLTDSMGFWRVDIPHCIKEFGFEGTVPEMHAILRNTVYEIPGNDEGLQIKVSGEKLQAAYRRIVSTLNELYSTAKLKPGMKTLLEQLKANDVRMCIATATAREQVEICLKSAGISDYFEFLVCAGEYKNGKMTPEIFIDIMKRFGALTSETAVYEDSLYSIKTAKRIGLYVIGVEDRFAVKHRDEIIKLCDEYIAID
ncbi:MAG: HAD family phosphatase [Clostridia bacterium]|nr:HAD family phosphatase [Clostridia bacterium]MEE1024433.1 HAD family phosphatase [Acutalibacteraceae bacterium]